MKLFEKPPSNTFSSIKKESMNNKVTKNVSNKKPEQQTEKQKKIEHDYPRFFSVQDVFNGETTPQLQRIGHLLR